MKLFSLRTAGTFCLLALFVLTVSSCSSSEESKKALVKGTITVADSIDATGNFSGIELTIIDRDSAGATPDTLYHELTDPAGNFEGFAKFDEKSYYPLYLRRGGQNIAQLSVILADSDTLNITAELPGVNETLQLQSREHEAMDVYQRVDRGFMRIAALGRVGAVPDSQMVDELIKWSDLYWEVWQKYDNTLASWLALEKSARLLSGIDNQLMVKRIDEGLPADYVVGVAVNYVKPYLLETKGLEHASRYLDSLAEISKSEGVKELVLRDKIELYFDSSEVKKARKMLKEYEAEYNDNPSSRKWTRRIRYDLNYLAPGLNVPEFSFRTPAGDTISMKSLKGTPYILEISPLANREYMNDYDRTIVIYEIYKNFGLKIFTIPLDQSQITVNGFFEERRQVWPVAEIGSFDVQEIVQKFNITQVPTRFLVDKNGVLVRKYVRNEFQDVLEGLNRILNNTNQGS